MDSLKKVSSEIKETILTDDGRGYAKVFSSLPVWFICSVFEHSCISD
jgi:hypothetical protein